MVTRKTKKLAYNTVVIALLVMGVAYVCSRFIHLGNVEYTDNAQVGSTSRRSIHGCRDSSRKSVSKNTGRYTKAIHCL